MMNKSGPRIDLCGTPVLTGRRLDSFVQIVAYPTTNYLKDLMRRP